MLDLTDLAIFAQVAETKCFSTAASRLGISKATVSKHVAGLEAVLGTRLLNRTTRRVTLTDAGAALFQHCARIIAEADQAASSIVRASAAPQGVLRTTAPAAFGLEYVMPAITDVLNAFPNLAIDLALTNRLVDMDAEKIDLALRVAAGPEAKHVWRPLGPCPMVLCASREYLARHAPPQHPDDLKHHACILYTVPNLWQFWRFQRGEQEFIVRVAGRFCSDSGEAMCAALHKGLGLAIIPRFYVEQDLKAGTLVAVLEEYKTAEYSAYLVYPYGHQTSGAVLTLAERIESHFRSGSSRSDASPARPKIVA